MCLSTVYGNEIAETNIIMENVMMVECNDETVILTDLFGRKMELEGKLLKANLTDGYVVLET